MTNRLCYVCEGGDCTEKGSGDVFDKLRDFLSFVLIVGLVTAIGRLKPRR